MSSENSKTSDLHRLILNLSDKTDLERSDKYVALSILSMYYTWKNIKKNHTKTINLKYQLQCRATGLNYLTDYIQDYFEYILKNMEERIIIFQ